MANKIADARRSLIRAKEVGRTKRWLKLTKNAAKSGLRSSRWMPRSRRLADRTRRSLPIRRPPSTPSQDEPEFGTDVTK